MSVNGEKLLKREKPRELIFPSNYDLLRHLQYATHFPIPLVSHGSIGVYQDEFITWSLGTWLSDYPPAHLLTRNDVR